MGHKNMASNVIAITNAAKAVGIDVSVQATSFVLGYAAAQAPAQPKAKERTNTSLMIVPRFTVIDKSKAEPIMAAFVKKTRNESGCLYYGWSMCDDQLVCEEIYVDATAVAVHLKNIAEQL